MSSIKPLSNEEKVITGGVVALALILLASTVGLVKCGDFGGEVAEEIDSSLESVSTDALVDKVDVEASEESALLSESHREKEDLEDALDRALDENKSLNKKLSASLSANEVNSEKGRSLDAGAASGLAAAGVALSPEDAGEVHALKEKVARLQDQLKKAPKEGDTAKESEELAEMKAKFVRLKNTNDELQSRNKNLDEKLQAMANGLPQNSEQGNADIEAALKARDADWQKKLVKAEMEKAARVEELQKQIRGMEMDAPQDPDAPVFVKTTDNLPFAAKQLLGELQKIEEMTDPDMEKIYGVVKAKTGGVSKGRVKFATGKSSLGPQGRATVDDISGDINEGSMLLVVGFADKTGDGAANERISSARATSVAERLLGKLPKGQRIKAVYLGETDRFGAQKENRVVEVWEIAK